MNATKAVSYLEPIIQFIESNYRHELYKLTGILMSLLRLVLGIERVLAFWS